MQIVHVNSEVVKQELEKISNEVFVTWSG